MSLFPEHSAEKSNNQEKIETSDAVVQENTEDKNLQKEVQASDPINEDPNWRAFREARKKDRSEREAAEKRAAEKEAEAAALRSAMEAAFSKSSQNQNQAYNDQYVPDETEDERIEKKVQAAIEKREEETRINNLKREQQEYPQRLMRSFSDFNQVVAQENLDYLDYHYPEVSRPLQRLGDGFDKWSDIYHAVKKFVPNNSNAKKDALRADFNSQKPRSISSASITQPGESISSIRLTEQKRAANWERMQKTLKGVG